MALEGAPRDPSSDAWKDFPPTEPSPEIIPNTEKPEITQVPPDVAEAIVREINENEDEEQKREDEIEKIKRRIN